MNIEELALRAGFWCVTDKEGQSEWMCREGCLERFAELVAAAEREACAKLFDAEVWSYDYREIAAAIRARGDKHD